MKTVYILQSRKNLRRFYSGVTDDHEVRLKGHNAGKCVHTAKYRPWRMRVAILFDDNERAYEFERYLKTGSGRAFAKKHF